MPQRAHELRNNTALAHSTQKQCISIGMDQGFHNYLVYSGQLDRIMDVKYFPQGEGPVNTLGEFWCAVDCFLLCTELIMFYVQFG